MDYEQEIAKEEQVLKEIKESSPEAKQRKKIEKLRERRKKDEVSNLNGKIRAERSRISKYEKQRTETIDKIKESEAEIIEQRKLVFSLFNKIGGCVNKELKYRKEVEELERN